MPKQPKTYTRQVYSVEVLSEAPLPDPIELDVLVYEITEGHSSGVFQLVSSEQVDGPTMARLLKAQGSDPEFFDIPDDPSLLERAVERETGQDVGEATAQRARMNLDTAAAFQIVLDLARQNIVSEDELPEEHARQTQACDMIEDVAVNNYGDQ